MSGSGAAYIQLYSKGLQDTYLTGTPRITYFAGIYKRHTPFVLESYDIPFNSQLVHGGTAICRIPQKGDLLRALSLKLTLPPLYNPGTDFTWPSQPNNTNFPTLWFGLSDGTITPAISASSHFSFYSTSKTSLSYWTRPFRKYVSYISASEQFVFINVMNVIVSSNTSPNLAGSGVFWGLDPVLYSSRDIYGNLVYTATISPLSNLTSNSISNSTANTFISSYTPQFTLEQAGWIQLQGLPSDPQSGLYVHVNQNIPVTNQSQFVNLQSTGTSGVQWTPDNVLKTRYIITPGGCVQFLQSTYYVLRAGFTLDAGSVVSVSYGTSPTDGPPALPVFQYTYTYTVSTNPTPPCIIPLFVSSEILYYYFYITTTGATNATVGSYISVSLAAEIYVLKNNIILPTAASQQLQLYSNIYTPLNGIVSLSTQSQFKFVLLGNYLLTGSLTLTGTPEPYITHITIYKNGSTFVYDYDLTLQGVNPTYAFSIPIYSNINATYFTINITTTAPATLRTGSFFVLTQIGYVSGVTLPSTTLSLNGYMLRPTNTTYTNPLNLSTNFGGSNSSTFISINTDGSLQFANTIAFMLTCVLDTVTVGITSLSLAGQTFTIGVGLRPPYTISLPFTISDNLQSYAITTTYTGDIPVMNVATTYISIVPLASNVGSSFLTQYSYHDAVGSLAIQRADLKIGGQTIQTLTGEYIEIYNELNVPFENQPGLQLMTGKYDQTNIGLPGRTYYVNLPFYFYGHPELAVPITALGRQDVEIWIDFNNFSNLTQVSVTSPIISATIIAEYIYLADAEIQWFQNHRLEYVITQTQYETFQLPKGFQHSIFQLHFKNQIKELFFMVKRNTTNEYDYSGNDLKSIGLSFNGQDFLSETTTDATYLGTLEPLNNHINFFSLDLNGNQGRQFYMSALARNGSGQVNFSRVQQVLLTLTNYNASGYYPAKTFRIIAESQNILRVENGIAGIMFG